MLTLTQFKQKYDKSPQFKKLTAARKKALYDAYVRREGNTKKPKGAPNSKAAGTALGSLAGSFLPGPFKALAPLAGAAGGWLGNKIGTILGLGEYKVRQNSIIGEGTTPPSMHAGNDTTIIRHREYLGDLFSAPVPGDFQVTNYALQPGVQHTFPWLSELAQGFQEWRPMGMVFEFKSNTGMISSAATPAVGMVVMATDYDSYYVDPFKNKVDMENTVYTTSAKSTESFYHPIECAPDRNVFSKLFVRHNEVPEGQPPQLYDLGTFAIATVGQPVASQNLGEVWVTYEIALTKATMRNFQTTTIDTDYFCLKSATPSKKIAMEFMDASIGNSIGCTLTGNGSNSQTINFPEKLQAGTYQFQFNVWSALATTWGSASGLTATYLHCVNDSQALQGFIQGPPGPWSDPSVTGYQGAPSVSVSTILFSLTFRVRVTWPGASFTLNWVGVTWTGQADGASLQICKVNANTTNFSALALETHVSVPRRFVPKSIRPSDEMAMVRKGTESRHNHFLESFPTPTEHGGGHHEAHDGEVRTRTQGDDCCCEATPEDRMRALQLQLDNLLKKEEIGRAYV